MPFKANLHANNSPRRHRFAISKTLMVLAGICLLALPARAQDLKPQLDDMVEHFIEVVFGQEYKNVGQAQKVLARWENQPINVSLQGSASQELVSMAKNRLGGIANLTGIEFRLAKPGGPNPSMDVLFLPRAQMSKIEIPGLDPSVIQNLTNDPTMVCFFLNWKQPEERIVKSIIAVNTDREPARLDACLLEEFTQVMGLPNDVKTYWKTLFNPSDVSHRYSLWDAVYLNTLYDPRLKPGMTPDQVRTAVRPIFSEVLSKAVKKQ